MLASTPHHRMFEAAFVDVAFHAVGAFMVIAQQSSYSAPSP
ncbi:hypothetical protein [Streptomyces phaeoluteigriseus]|nr:hypothetical protein [Streptomyces phaeoluteigriseus]